jgi:hypothetical protein
MRFEIGRVDHDRLALGALGRKAIHHRHEDTLVAPSLPAVVERVCRTIFPGRIPLPQPIAIDEDNAAKDAVIIDPRSTMTPRKERLKPSHLLIRQPKKIAHNQGSSRSLNQITPSRSMGPDPRRIRFARRDAAAAAVEILARSAGIGNGFDQRFAKLGCASYWDEFVLRSVFICDCR